MDLRLRSDSGARLTSAIRTEFPGARVLVISNYDGDEDIHQALAAGAMSYLFKSVVEDKLVDAIREVNFGRRYLPKGVAARLQENTAGVHLTPPHASRRRIAGAAGKRLGKSRARLGVGNHGGHDQDPPQKPFPKAEGF